MVSSAGYAPVFLLVLAGDAVPRSMPRSSTESASSCVPVHFCHVSVAVALEALGDYTVPIVGFAFMDLMVPY